MNAGEAAWNLRVVSKTPPSPQFINQSTPGDFRLINSDLSFVGQYVIQGNFSGYQVWDISQAEPPDAAHGVRLPGLAERRLGVSKSDVRVG